MFPLNLRDLLDLTGKDGIKQSGNCEMGIFSVNKKMGKE
jgi:hypothetical protein